MTNYNTAFNALEEFFMSHSLLLRAGHFKTNPFCLWWMAGAILLRSLVEVLLLIPYLLFICFLVNMQLKQLLSVG